MLGRSQPTRTSLGSSSNTAPPPTSAKSRPHASVIAGSYSKSLASTSRQHELAAEDPAVLVAPLGERDRGVVHLLVQALHGAALVGDRADRDRVVGDASRPSRRMASPSWHTASRSPKPPSARAVAPPAAVRLRRWCVVVLGARRCVVVTRAGRGGDEQDCEQRGAGSGVLHVVPPGCSVGVVGSDGAVGGACGARVAQPPPTGCVARLAPRRRSDGLAPPRVSSRTLAHRK